MTMSMNQIFKKVSRHLIKQNAKCTDGDTCQYRNEAGQSCAIGCLIPDADYHDELEGSSTSDDLVKKALHSVIGVDPASRINKLALLDDLQTVHDDADVIDWPTKLERVRDCFNLEKVK
jgi:hypothetical protein